MPVTRRKAALAFFAAIVLGWWALLPPAAQPTPPAASSGNVVKGAHHIHSTRSDGSGSIQTIARAAADAGLAFIVLTDHGDATRTPDEPVYIHGVLVIDAVEISTSRGHYAAIGLPAAPYPLAGDAADVIEDVRRLGGFGFVAHPDSPRVALAWQDFHVDFDGIEWLNVDSSWRDESRTQLVRSLATYLLRAPETLTALLDRPSGLLARWDALGQLRRVPAIAAADAHARMGFRQNTDPDLSSVHVRLPSYQASFRTFSNHVVLAQPLSGQATGDASLVLDALRSGRMFTVIDGLATPGGLEFSVASGGKRAAMGEDLDLNGDVIVTARVSAPASARVLVFRAGEPVYRSNDAAFEWNAGAVGGVYRLEAHLGAGDDVVPWILSNPIYVGLHRETRRSVPALAEVNERSPARTNEASAEFGTGDTSRVAPTSSSSGSLEWRFRLRGGEPSGQFAAVQVPVAGGLATAERVRFRVTAVRPMRLRIQLRSSRSGERWGRTFYADATARELDLSLRGFTPIGSTSTIGPPLDQVDSLLFVADTLNALPGSEGQVSIAEVAFVR